jgi:hypothetical protein
MGEERIVALLQGSLSIAVKTGAMKPTDTCQVTVDTTVQPKNVMVPTDAKLIHRAHGRLVRLAKRAGLDCARPMCGSPARPQHLQLYLIILAKSAREATECLQYRRRFLP